MQERIYAQTYLCQRVRIYLRESLVSRLFARGRSHDAFLISLRLVIPLAPALTICNSSFRMSETLRVGIVLIQTMPETAGIENETPHTVRYFGRTYEDDIVCGLTSMVRAHIRR